MAIDVLSSGNEIFLAALLKRNPSLAQKIAKIESWPDVLAIDCVCPTMKRQVLQCCDRTPFVTDLPDSIEKSVYRAAVDLALSYTKGVEGSMHGHTLVLGDPETVLKLGKRNMLDPFESRSSLDIREPVVAEEMRRCMLADGMSVVNGLTGAPVANKFFSDKISETSTGGARTRSAWAMAEQAECIVIVISADSKGEISILRGRGEGCSPDRASYCLCPEELACEACSKITLEHAEKLAQHAEIIQQQNETIQQQQEVLDRQQQQIEQLRGLIADQQLERFDELQHQQQLECFVERVRAAPKMRRREQCEPTALQTRDRRRWLCLLPGVASAASGATEKGGPLLS